MNPTPHDSLFRRMFRDPAHARGVLQAALPGRVNRRIRWDTLRLVPGSFVDDELRWRHSDLLLEVELSSGEAALVYLLFEHQSDDDSMMGLRLVTYQVRIWEDWRRAHPRARKLPAILPVVLHHSRRTWQAPTEFSDLFAVDQGFRQAAGQRLLQQRFVLRDLNLDDESTLRLMAASDLARVTLSLLRYARSLAELGGIPPAWIEVFRAVGLDPGRAAVRALVSYIGEVGGDADARQLRPVFDDTLGEVWSSEMKTLKDQFREQGREEGRESGQRQLLRVLLEDRFGELSPEIEQRIETATRVEIERFARRVLHAGSIRGVFVTND